MYVTKRNWYLQGPGRRRGMGQTACVCADGSTGDLGPDYPCADGSMPTCTTKPTGFPASPAQNASPIAGIPNNYLYLGGAVLAAFLLIGAMKK